MGTFTRAAALLVCGWIATTCGVAAAQGCADGRVASETSAGRCCWPGQLWSESDARCDGIPVCPDGFGGDGNTCIPLVASPPPLPEPPSVAPSAAALLASPRMVSPPLLAFATPPPSSVRRVNNNIVFNGLALAIATYGGSLAEGLLWGGSFAYFIPYGALVGAIQSASFSGFSAATGFAFGLGQVVATVLMVAGATCFRRRPPAQLTNTGFAITF